MQTPTQQERIDALQLLSAETPLPDVVHLYDNNTFAMADVIADAGEWLVLNDAEALEAATEQIKESLWAFTPSWLVDYMPEGMTVSGVIAIQGDRCEEANEDLLSLIRGVGPKNFDILVQGAIDTDGRGHFLSHYDNEEIQSACGRFFFYRVN